MPLPSSSLTGVTLTATSGNPPVLVGTQTIPLSSLSLGANSVQITDSNILAKINSGDTITPSLQLNYANGLSVVSTTGTSYFIPPPPPLVMLDTNGVTLKYTSSSIPSGQSNPYIVNVSGTYYAVMSSDNSDSKSKIKAYANLVGSNPNPTTATPSFTAPDNTPIPFNRIVTTLMTDMSSMFDSVRFFNQRISSWDTSKVTNMASMFHGANGFNNGNAGQEANSGIAGIGYWDTSKVTNMSFMFAGCPMNSNIGSWDVSSVINMERMFFSTSFTNGNNNSPSIGSWQTLNVKNMKGMFSYSYYFNRDISTWNVSGLLENPMPGFSQNSGLTNPLLLPPAFRPPPDYSVTNFARVGEFEYSQFGNPNYYPVPKYLTYIQFKSSSVGGVYAHKFAYYPTSNPANKIVLLQAQPATGPITQAAVYPLEPASSYTVAITLVNKNTGEELTNLQPVQTITFTTPTPPSSSHN